MMLLLWLAGLLIGLGLGYGFGKHVGRQEGQDATLWQVERQARQRARAETLRSSWGDHAT